MVAATSALRAQTSTLPTGASAAFTSDDPVLREITQIISGGEFPPATLVAKLDEPVDDTHVAAARQEMKEILRRFKHEYSLSPQALLEKVKAKIPDATAEDLERWRQRGELQYRMIDGQVAYFRREPSNLLRFSEEAKKRVQPAPPGEKKFVLADHLGKVIEEAHKSGKTEVAPIKHRIRYRVTVPGNRPGARRGSMLRVWLPYPQEYRQQKDVKLVSASQEDIRITPSGMSKDGKILPHAQRTVYFEKKIDDPARKQMFEVEFEYTSYAYYPVLRDAEARPLSADFDKTYLAERAPHILFTPELKETVAKVVGDETNPLARARKIFYYVDSKVKYCAEEEYCLIPSFSSKAFSAEKGDCGLQGILFVTMCRAAGIPARWQSGWQTLPVNWNMHDWAEFYVEPWGWLPADPSYGLQKSDRPEIREFYFGHQDSYRLIVNLDYGSPLLPAKKSLRSEPADFQRGEVELDGRNLYFDEWEHHIEFERADLHR